MVPKDENANESRKRRMEDTDLFSDQTDSARHKSSKRNSKEREYEKESSSRGRSSKGKEKSTKSSPTKGQDMPELMDPRKEKRSGSSSGGSSSGRSRSKSKLESDEDYEDEMKGYSALTIKPKQNVTMPSPTPEKSPARVSAERSLSLSPTKSNNTAERLGKSSQSPKSSPSPSEKTRRSKEKVDVKSEKERETRRGSKRIEKIEKSRDSKERSTTTKERESRKTRQEKEKEQYANRKSAVLSRNYRKRHDPNSIILDDENNRKSASGSATDPLQSGDIDLRFEGLKDVDLRNDADQQPLSKKPRTGTTLIEDLFGQEDVDLRQTSSSWSQVKKPSTTSPISSSVPRGDDSEKYSDIRDMLVRPPSAISPATSVGSTRSSCDPLGRPLLFARLPDDPEERKRSLDSRSASIDPVEEFCVRYIEKPSRRPGGLTLSDLNFAFTKSQQEFESGNLTQEQQGSILKRLVQVNEFHKIQEVQQSRGSNGPRNGHGPWAGNAMWAPRQGFGPRGGRFPGPVAMQRPPWGGSQWNPARPRGPNPFLEAMPRPDDFVPEANRLEVATAERDMDCSIPLDKIPRQIRFYGETAIVFLGAVGDEPREISFQKGGPAKIVLIDKEPFKVMIGSPCSFYIDKVKHMVRIGAPKRELYIDGDGYETCFGGPPISIRIGPDWHSFKLEGPPPQVEVGKEKRYDLVAGRVTLFIDSNSVPIYLDDKPQLLDLCGFPVILKFSDEFYTVILNGRPFPAKFGGAPMSITLPNGRQHFLRFAAVSPATEEAMMMHNRLKHELALEEGATSTEGHFGPNFRGRGILRGRGIARGRGGPRAPGPGFGLPNAPHPDHLQHLPRSHNESDRPFEENPLDMLANILPHSSTSHKSSKNQENAYESESSFLEDTDGRQEQVDSTTPKADPAALSVDDLLNKLLMAGILHSVGGPKTEPEADAVVGTTTPVDGDKDKDDVAAKVKVEENPAADSTNLPPLETVTVTFKDNMRERRVKLIDQICTGIQCASCGLRFAPDQTFRYTQHLDWHFRQNRREKGNSKKALSRKWYYDLSDWIQFEEIEDLEERAASMFEFQDGETEGEERSTGTILNPDSYTVPAVGHEGETCPQCGEGFETFYDEEADEWRLRDALLSPETEGEPSKLYHPICHQDLVASLQDETMTELEAEPEPEKPVETPAPEPVNPPEDDEDEVLILKEGKKEVVLMEIDVEDDDNPTNVVIEGEELKNQDSIIRNDKKEIDSTIVEHEKNNTKETESLPVMASLSSQSILSPIVVNDDEESNSNIPGLATSDKNSGVFGFALGLDSSQGQQPTSEEPKRIVYNSWQFDFPKIKIEPPGWDEIDESQVIMSKDYQVNENQDPLNITLDEENEDSQSQHSGQVAADKESVDIDLTGDDDVATTSVGALVAEIDGNLEFKGDNLIPLVAPTKIRINISGLDALNTAVSPTRKGSPTQGSQDENSGDSQSQLTLDSPRPSTPQNPGTPEAEILPDMEELKRLKPRLVGRKLVNCPPKSTGKEESGLCVIC
jgi:hypothetical protein